MSKNQKYRLFANENCYGCSPAVIKAIRSRQKYVSFYPESDYTELMKILADKHRVNARNIAIGAGSVEIIDCIIRSFSEVGDEVVTFKNTFIMYEHLALSHKRVCRLVPLVDLRCNPKSLLPFINSKTKIIFIANPNNPTGTIITHAEVEHLLNRLPANIIVVLDEAYSEYTTDLNFPNSIALQRRHPNLVILHSFSKIYGLAGLRIGYGIMEENTASIVSKARIQNSINYLAPPAAIAALDDIAFINTSVNKNETERNFLFQALVSLKFKTIASQANFLYLWFDNETEKRATFDLLIANDITICDLRIYGQEKALRITVGSNAANQKIVAVLSDK